MKARNIVMLVSVAVLLSTVLYTFIGSQDQTAYNAEVSAWREERDRFLKTSAESPFKDNVDSYKGLNYYPSDITYKVTADLQLINDKKPVALTTSDGAEQYYLPYAYASFELNGYANRLLILEYMEPGPQRGTLFLAFGDETSAAETYGAGRYLDVAKTPGSNTITLDFNKAYNPYCAYVERFSCPFPPRENLLKVAIRAGEKTYH